MVDAEADAGEEEALLNALTGHACPAVFRIRLSGFLYGDYDLAMARQVKL